MSKTLRSKALKSKASGQSTAYKVMVDLLEKNLPKEDHDVFDPDLFAQMCETHWTLAKINTNKAPQIRLYCPLVEGKKSRKTVIDIVADDMTFLIDSVVAEINRHNVLIDFLMHPLLYAAHDKKGVLTDISGTQKDGYNCQSHVHIHIRETISESLLKTLEEGLNNVIEDVYIANRDWKLMLDKLKDARDELAESKNKEDPEDIAQYSAFIDYLYDNNFTLLGYREYQFVKTKGGLKNRIIKGRSLGLLHDEDRPAYINENQEGLTEGLQDLRKKLPAVFVSKTNRLATVHRRVPMDAIAIKSFDDKGNVIGEKLFLGLFTSVTYSRSVADVPYLREKVDAVVALAKLMPGSHDYKSLRHVLEKYPRDELFQIAPKQLLKICLNIVRLQERQRIALFMRKDPFKRYVSCLVYVPRERFGTDLRRKMAGVLERQMNGTCTAFTTSLDDSVFARVMYTIKIDRTNESAYDAKKIEKALQEIGQTWAERLSVALADEYDDNQEINELTLKYGAAFPAGYTSRYSAKRAISDIQKIKQVMHTQRLTLDLYKPSDFGEGDLRLKVYSLNEPLTLSDVMPILENLGLRAVSELPFEIKPSGADERVWIHDFFVQVKNNNEDILLKDIKDTFEEAFLNIWYGHVDNDALNKLILGIGLTGRDIIVLRTYTKYLKQINYPYGQAYIQKALIENAPIARKIVEIFRAMHDPSAGNDNTPKNTPKAGFKAIEKLLADVDSLDQDKILRSITAILKSTLRTNFFQTDEAGVPKTYLSIKLDSAAISDIPNPKPFREVFVYSPRMEGVHLRGDEIARGGIRWSDRHEDFRTEVLGLMKAQMVKNAVIVPMGAKGGFVVKRPPADRSKFREEGIECYKILVRGLLDITDNREGEDIIPPTDVVRHDAEDPYLVVAADKGTATFSDIANGLSKDYGFWLDDAFASGGSAGYDHKKMGITARGAWESVKLHFRQLNHDTQTQDFDVIGVGDMGGDVFGNGMLLSKHIHLVGAFNHLHIFCDPDPDPKTSMKERQRLFKGVMGWGEYNTKLLSKGGMIYSRSDKVLKLTPEIQKRFDIASAQVSPLELMHAMLKARTDLLWFGGIGTYVKAPSETHLDVGDKANDAIRVDGNAVRAKVIAEGANLGLTQLGRIDFERSGGRINTDFIDNSGGVDSSDHEVNIKILLTDVMQNADHKMDITARNKLLESMTEEVADKVLNNNYQQNLALSLAEFQAADRLKAHEGFIQFLETEKAFDRKLENLPGAKDIETRLRTGKGLTRPELSILLSYSKIDLTQDLMNTTILDEPDMQGWLLRYFPTALQNKFKPEILRHRLKHGIVAMRLANSLINRMGPTFYKRVQKQTGAGADDIIKAYMMVIDMFKLRDVWFGVQDLDTIVQAEIQLQALKETSDLIEYVVLWFLSRATHDRDIAADAVRYIDDMQTLKKAYGTIFTPALKEKIKNKSTVYEKYGIPETLAKTIARLSYLSGACDIVRIAWEQDYDLKTVGKVYFEMADLFHFRWLRGQARFLTSEDHWETLAIKGLINQLYDCQASLTLRVLQDMSDSTAAPKALGKNWLDAHPHIDQKLSPFFDKMKNEGTATFPMLTIAEQRLRSII